MRSFPCVSAAVTLCTLNLGALSSTTLLAQEPPRVGERAILEALEEPVVIELAEVPLSDALDLIAQQQRIPLLIDREALDDAGVDPALNAATLKVTGIRLRSALNLLLRPFELTWLIEDDVLTVTTQEHADSKLFTKIYPVADLLEPTLQDPLGSPTIDDLLQVLESCVAPESWTNVGGSGSAAAIQGSLIVSQSYPVHQQIARLFEELRAARPKSLAQSPLPSGAVTRSYYVGGAEPESLAEAVVQVIAPDTWGNVTGHRVIALRGQQLPTVLGGVGCAPGIGVLGSGFGGGFFNFNEETEVSQPAPEPASELNLSGFPSPPTGWLVVRTTPDVQRSVEGFLRGLRVLNSAQTVREAMP